jgi:hypothetical protein
MLSFGDPQPFAKKIQAAVNHRAGSPNQPTNQVWLSNPLYMNDLREMREGICLVFYEFPVAAQRALVLQRALLQRSRRWGSGRPTHALPCRGFSTD